MNPIWSWCAACSCIPAGSCRLNGAAQASPSTCTCRVATVRGPSACRGRGTGVGLEIDGEHHVIVDHRRKVTEAVVAALDDCGGVGAQVLTLHQLADLEIRDLQCDRMCDTLD